MNSGTNQIVRRSVIVAIFALMFAVAPGTQAADQVLMLSGSTGSGYTIEGSDNLTDWETVRTVDNVSGALQISYSELGSHAYYRVTHNGASDLKAIGLAVYEEVQDPAQLEAARLAARDRALQEIASADTQFTAEQINTLFSDFATQEAFNSALSSANSAAAATDSQASVNRILDVLSNTSSTVSAADLESIRTAALSSGLVGGITAQGGTVAEATAAVQAATQNLSTEAQQLAASLAQAAGGAASAAQFLGLSQTEVLAAIQQAVASILNGS